MTKRSIDGVVRRIDINALVERIDINGLVDRIDVQRVVDRIDVENLVLRSNVGAILTQSTTGVLTQFIDTVRVQVVVVDLYLLRASRGYACFQRRAHDMLPPRPGHGHGPDDDNDRTRIYQDNHTRVPHRRMDKAIAVQGRYAGLCSKGTAAFVDVTILTLSFGFILILGELLVILLLNQNEELNTRQSFHKASDKAKELHTNENWSNVVAMVAYCIYWFLYFFLGPVLFGQTIGMSVVGIKLVDAHDGRARRVSPRRAFLRTLLLPLTLHIFPLPLCVVGGCCRRDGRMLHDYVAGSGLIYKWNARLTKMRDRTIRRIERETSSSSFYSRQQQQQQNHQNQNYSYDDDDYDDDDDDDDDDGDDGERGEAKTSFSSSSRLSRHIHHHRPAASSEQSPLMH